MSPPILSDIGVQSVDLICWFTPERWRPGRLFILAGEVGADKVYRMSISLKEGQLSLLLDHYLRDTPDSVEHCSERIELGLFTRDEMTWAFEFNGMEVRYDSEGLMGRGLYVGKHESKILPAGAASGSESRPWR